MNINAILQLQPGMKPVEAAGQVTYATNQSEGVGQKGAWTRQFVVIEDQTGKIGVTLWDSAYAQKGSPIRFANAKTETNQKGELALTVNNVGQPSAPQQNVAPPQAPPQARQQPVHVPVGRDATGLSIERQACYKATCELASRRPDLMPDIARFVDWLGHGHDWIATGKVDFRVTHQPVDTKPAKWDAPVDEFDAKMAEPDREPGDDDCFR